MNGKYRQNSRSDTNNWISNWMIENKSNKIKRWYKERDWSDKTGVSISVSYIRKREREIFTAAYVQCATSYRRSPPILRSIGHYLQGFGPTFFAYTVISFWSFSLAIIMFFFYIKRAIKKKIMFCRTEFACVSMFNKFIRHFSHFSSVLLRDSLYCKVTRQFRH